MDWTSAESRRGSNHAMAYIHAYSSTLPSGQPPAPVSIWGINTTLMIIMHDFRFCSSGARRRHVLYDEYGVECQSGFACVFSLCLFVNTSGSVSYRLLNYRFFRPNAGKVPYGFLMPSQGSMLVCSSRK